MVAATMPTVTQVAQNAILARRMACQRRVTSMMEAALLRPLPPLEPDQGMRIPLDLDINCRPLLPLGLMGKDPGPERPGSQLPAPCPLLQPEESGDASAAKGSLPGSPRRVELLVGRVNGLR